MMYLTLPVISILLILYSIYKWATQNHDYFEKRHIKYVKPTLLLGSTGKMFYKLDRFNDLVNKLYNAFPKEKIYGAFDFRRPFYVIRDPKIAKRLTVKDFVSFEDRRLFLDASTYTLFGRSLIMLRGQKWRDMRATLSPAFTSSKMRQMFELVVEYASDMADYFRLQLNAGNEQRHEMKCLFGKYTNDIIASTAFGLKVNSFENENNDFIVAGKRIMTFYDTRKMVLFFILRIFPKSVRKLIIRCVYGKPQQFFPSMILNTINIRDKNNIFRPDMINIMMHIRKGSTDLLQQNVKESTENDGFATVEESSIGKVAIKGQWTDSEIVAQCFIFFLGGFDTSSTLLSFTAYELAINPDVQGKLYLEISEIHNKLNGKKITYDEIQTMKYMDMVISETLRKWPPIMFLERLCGKDYEYNDGRTKFMIYEGEVIWIPTYGLHHDEQYFPNPEKFDPDRFSDDNKGNIVPGSYLPFGMGPRSCIASRFALMEVKAIFYYFLLNFKLEPTAETQIPLILSKGPIGVSGEKGIHLEIKLRQDENSVEISSI